MSPVVKRRRRRFKGVTWALVVVALIVAAGGIGGVLYFNHQYQQNLRALSTDQKRIRVTIPSGADAKAIGQILEEKEVIRNGQAFSRYVKRINANNRLQAGTYALSPSYSVAEITQILVEGKVDDFNLTLVPGRRLDQITESLVKADFSREAIQAALKKKYSHPLFAGKPSKQDLEGYIFPDTYRVSSETTAEQLLVKTFENFYAKLEAEDIPQKLEAQGLSLYEGITLASIVQQEVTTYAEQQKVAQVFLSRLDKDMPLGADPTFRYASYKLGIADSVNADSPYNTRRYKGLPPGPIANFNMSAIRAVANPATTDFLFFVAGDDGITRFSRTVEEHNQLKEQYCIELCKL